MAGHVPALAQPRRRPPPPAPAPPAPTAELELSADEQARVIFARGEASFREGRFAAALEHFRAAYALRPLPALQYNVGLAADRLRRDAEALTAFEAYLASVPDAPNRAEVEARVGVLRARAADADADPGPARVEPPRSTATETSTTGPWVLTVTGGVVAIAGVVLVGVALGQIANVESSTRPAVWESVRGDYELSQPLSISGFIAMGLGAAMATAGVAWLIAGRSQESGVTVQLMPTGASLRGHF